MQRVFLFYGRTEKYKVCDPPITSAPLIQKIQLRKLMNRSEEMYLINYEAFTDKGLGGKGQPPSPTTILPPTLHC